MAWKATGQPTVRKQRDKWVVRVDGIDRNRQGPKPHATAKVPGSYACCRCRRRPSLTIEPLPIPIRPTALT